MYLKLVRKYSTWVLIFTEYCHGLVLSVYLFRFCSYSPHVSCATSCPCLFSSLFPAQLCSCAPPQLDSPLTPLLHQPHQPSVCHEHQLLPCSLVPSTYAAFCCKLEVGPSGLMLAANGCLNGKSTNFKRKRILSKTSIELKLTEWKLKIATTKHFTRERWRRAEK